MSESAIASLHTYSGRFLRSTDLVRDFDDPHGLQGYWLTDFGRSCLTRISDGLRPGSGRRSWRLTGDFGSGKSSFALLLANLANDARHRLPTNLFNQVILEVPDAKQLRYVPILVTATRERMGPAILRAISRIFGTLYSRRGIRSELELDIETLLKAPEKIKDAQVLEIVQRTNRKLVQSGKGSGLLLILDEVGKFLEFAAHNPEEQDIYFLQQLGELANRSGKEPIVVVCLLHQGFNAYAEQLSPASQREWEKIAGRFEEIVFRQPLDQVALLIASALNVNEAQLPAILKRQSIAAFEAGVACGWFGTSSSRNVLERLAHRLFPLDPLLLPVLVRTFQRFGQNERSLFSFLCSYEPFGLRAFSNKTLSKTSPPYQLADFYDYVRANLGHRLAVASYRTHWGVIESRIEAHPADKELEVRILKTVGVLNLLNVDDLRPTREALCWAVAGQSEEIRQQVLQLLQKLEGRDLHFRGEVRGYSLWPYTSVDIDGRLNEAKRAIPRIAKVSDVVRNQLDSRPVVARSHYIKTGNLRYFDIVYCEPDELESKLVETRQNQSDGTIVVPLCETKQEAETAFLKAKQSKLREDLVQVIAVSRPLHHLQQSALDASRWEWVQDNTPELNNDPYARDEVELHLQEARNHLQNQIQEFIGLNRLGGRTTLSWFYGGQEIRHESGRQVMRWLSSLCDDVFRLAPRIRNELVNRHNLSSAAAAARMRLIELMFSSADKANLGMPIDRKPPERSMYLSVLLASGLHCAQNGVWRLDYPPKSHSINLHPTLSAMRKMVMDRPDNRVSVDQLLAVVQQPPYGIRTGLFPILLAAMTIIEEQEIAFYENGTFLREVDAGVFLRITKAPDRFEVQHCKIEGLRSEVFEQLLTVLDVKETGGRRVEMLDVVRTLCVFVARLPEYTVNTRKLPPTAVAVRDIILQAREPAKLLFFDLPRACGFEPVTPSDTPNELVVPFVKTLRAALDDLRVAYIEMQNRMRATLRETFALPGTFQQFRSVLAARAERVLIGVAEPKLRAFCLRLLDDSLPESEWLESVGSFLALKPPEKWRDEDEELFNNDLAMWAERFHRVESINFAAGKFSLDSIGVRLSITQANGVEHEQVLHYSVEEEQRIKSVQKHFEQLLVQEGRIGLAAASRAIFAKLKKSGKPTKE